MSGLIWHPAYPPHFPPPKIHEADRGPLVDRERRSSHPAVNVTLTIFAICLLYAPLPRRQTLELPISRLHRAPGLAWSVTVLHNSLHDGLTCRQRLTASELRCSVPPMPVDMTSTLRRQPRSRYHRKPCRPQPARSAQESALLSSVSVLAFS